MTSPKSNGRVSFWRLRIPGLLLLSFLSPAVVSAREAEVTDLRTDLSGDRYLVTFRIDGAFPEEVEERIASGLETRFRHRIRVYRKRTGWFDKVLWETVATTTVNYDSLTSQYTLTRFLDGQLRDTSFTGDPEEMRRWMTVLEGIPVGGIEDLAGEGKYFVRVKSNLRSRFFLFFIPVNWNTKWEMIPLLQPGREGE